MVISMQFDHGLIHWKIQPSTKASFTDVALEMYLWSVGHILGLNELCDKTVFNPDCKFSSTFWKNYQKGNPAKNIICRHIQTDESFKIVNGVKFFQFYCSNNPNWFTLREWLILYQMWYLCVLKDINWNPQEFIQVSKCLVQRGWRNFHQRLGPIILPRELVKSQLGCNLPDISGFLTLYICLILPLFLNWPPRVCGTISV